jgi:predicted nucleic acid-binding protein
VIVVDASVLAPALGDDGPNGDQARERLAGEDLAAPEIVDLELMAVWRRTLPDPRRASLAVSNLARIPLARCTHRPLIARCWELRDNISPYDAAYIALAELLGSALLTADRRLARAPGIRCAVETIA